MPSPSYQNLQPAPAQQSPHFPPPSYANGGPATNSNANHPPPRPTHIPLNAAPPAPLNMSAPPTPNAPGTPGAAQQYTSQAFVPAINAPNTPGAMGPPTGRPQREYDYDVTDSLLGTGVNIRDEENALAEYYAGSFGQDARTGLPANAPGSRASFYGAGFANQPGAPTNVSQQEFEAAEAERAWNESAARLSAIRAVEANDSMLSFPQLHARMEKIAESHGLTLNLDNKSNTQGVNVQKSRNPAEYPTPKVTVTTKTGPDGALVSVYGSVLPPDSFLIDQMALLSLGVKQRLRGLIQEADKMATHRQQTSHGVVPMCFADDGIPLEAVGLFDPKDAERLGGASNSGGGGGAGGDDNPRKRGLAPLNPHSQYLRDYAYREREAEEIRMRKRQKLFAEEAAAQNGSRAGSAAPTTPGAVAPGPEKAPTKKEQKKIAAQKHDASAESVNMTATKFLGGGKKKYSWMSAGGGASSPRTPSRAAGGAQGTPASATTSKAPEKTNLTPEPRNKMGSWREFSEKGKNIQLRDWVEVLERDGREPYQYQYALLLWHKADARENDEYFARGGI